MLLSPDGRVYLDNYNDIHGIGSNIPFEIYLKPCGVGQPIHNKSLTYAYKDWYFLIYSIRQTKTKGYCVFSFTVEKDSLLRDVKWYRLYSGAGQPESTSGK